MCKWPKVNLPSVSPLQVVMKLVGADEQILIYSSNSLQWLSSTNLLEMLVGRLGPNVRPTCLLHPSLCRALSLSLSLSLCE